jgi:hypothetical protein
LSNTHQKRAKLKAVAPVLPLWGFMKLKPLVAYQLSVSAVWFANQLNAVRMVLVHDGIIKYQASIGRKSHIAFNMLPNDLPSQLITAKQAINRVMTETFAVIGKMRHRVIGLGGQNKLTPVDSIDTHLRHLSGTHIYLKIQARSQLLHMVCVSPDCPSFYSPTHFLWAGECFPRNTTVLPSCLIYMF